MQGQDPPAEGAVPDVGRVQDIRAQEADHAEVVLQVPNQQRLPHRFKRKLAVCLTFLAIVAAATLTLHSIPERVEHTGHHTASSNSAATPPLAASNAERHSDAAVVPSAGAGDVTATDNAPESDVVTQGPFEWPPLLQPL
ncbi:uncharacterized protein LOC125946331 [Dermacentor silvarum]|uniref:uncharacterized protein LOC125946331 n=1 Tax=Dermacentor silvarum TaxID=543639 RepID=UPI0021013DB1|nr:uncharacterized protein LOC125946331 [Dermacentor silvarum]